MRCFFHLAHADDVIRDDVGIELYSVGEAREVVLDTVREIGASDPEMAMAWRGWRLSVTDRAGQRLFSIALDAIGKSTGLSARPGHAAAA
jgi:hypothetical protein